MKTTMKTTLFEVLWKKEIIHWKRIKLMFNRFKGWPNKLTFGFIVAVFVTLGHYCFALMHTLFELLLFVFARNMFRANLQKMKYLKV
jgi:hypothetical protein